MVDGNRPGTGGAEEASSSDPAKRSSRRSSQSSNDGNTASSGAQYSNLTSSADSIRRRPQGIQTQPTGYGSITSPIHRQRVASPERQAKPKKPGMGRRATSTHIPHKGQEFSVDDAEYEIVEDDPPLQRAAKNPTLRRQPSTLRRKTTAQPPQLATVNSQDGEDAVEQVRSGAPTEPELNPSSSGEEGTLMADEGEAEAFDDEGGDDDGDDDGDLSDAESFTLKDRQEAINVTHPFGIRIWKPALYKKDRSVQKNAEGDIHSTPGLFVSNWLFLFNIVWTMLFGWWLAVVAGVASLVCCVFGCLDQSSWEYSKVLFHLAIYFFYPFGKYVKLMQDEAYAEEDEGEGRSISEYEQWQSGDIEEGRLFFGPPSRSLVGRRRNSIDSADETTSLLGRAGRVSASPQRTDTAKAKRRLFGRGKWNFGRVVFFFLFYGLLTPSLFFVSGICWLLVFTIPMGKVALLLFDHLRRHPLALSFHSDSADTRRPGDPASSILLCTYRAVGSKYWKYTIDGTNIFLINLLSIVAFTIFDYWVLDVALGLKIGITNQFFVFALALFSIIPLAYFIGQAVASISAQSSMGVGATINAFFSTVVEVFLYCVALNKGKAQLVEGSIIGSIFAGILFLPGLSMCFGALKRKTQRFNVKSAGVTSTMLLFAVIGAFGPTLFYQIYGSHELNCHTCIKHDYGNEQDCRRCYYSQVPAVHDRFYIEAVRPYIWFAAVMLFLSYVIGLLFTLRTHAAVIWSSELDEKKADKADMAASYMHSSGQLDGPGVLTRQATNTSIGGGLARSDIRESQLYKRILGQSFKQVGLGPNGEVPEERPRSMRSNDGQTPHVVPPKDSEDDREHTSLHLAGLSEEQNHTLVLHVAEMAATAAAVAARDATKAPRKAAHLAHTSAKHGGNRPPVTRSGTFAEQAEDTLPGQGQAAGGHDAPNWSRTKSAVILLTATLAYAVIAEILVGTVDAVLENVDIDEKFLGITLFALVPNTTEFLNAISFAMNGNIALSMEIGSAYALQVCLLQIPCLVLYSAIHGRYIDPNKILNHTFTLLFPQWDMVTVILCVFLLSYMYGEGKSNYFKGSILILSYLVVIVGFYFSSFNDFERMGVDASDTLAVGGLVQSMSFKTIGRPSNGRAY
ncbi:calcium permease family membrane transporter [Lophium mytilinum]|uniref:Calcium permease family membrane transporter n=1 Tax=Lophium mytilinum TaxID=390894 RepID=A0A6A6R660_9PEZI|nr:calcium permease family membrane transporter [Lophium mytilinum]